MYCVYYTAAAHRQMIWLIIAHIKSNDNAVFHRTMDGTKDVLEFFVSPELEYRLIEWLDLYVSEGLLFSYQKQENRLINTQ